MTFKIVYDDQIMDIMDKVNAALEPFGLVIEDDEQVHDGWMEYEVKRINQRPSDMTPSDTFQPGDEIRCVRKEEEWHDLTIGKTYIVAFDEEGDPSCYFHDGKEYVQLTANDSDEPYTHWLADCFEKTT